MKEKPILFNGEMVRALLSGRKTQTRRIIKPQPDGAWAVNIETGEHTCIKDATGKPWYNIGGINGLPQCPYGQPGHKLWVRETWARWDKKRIDNKGRIRWMSHTEYRADGRGLPTVAKWRPSIHMPRYESRISLTIEDVRVERVQDIMEEDAIKEGVPEWANKDDITNGHYLDRPLETHWCEKCQGEGTHGAMGENMGVTEADCSECDTSIKLFRNLWDSINAKRGYGWDTNPWVFVIEFKLDKR